MLDNLQPALTKNGLVGCYTNSSGTRSFGILIIKPNDPSKEKILSLVKEQIYGSNQTRPYKLNSLTTIFAGPLEVTLVHGKNIYKQIHNALQGSRDVFFVAADQESYAEACRSLSITRADHLACAEMQALLSPKSSEEKYVAGQAHKIRDSLIKRIKRPDRNFIKTAAGKALITMVKECINEIPHAIKFQLGKSDNRLMAACPQDKPYLFKLPFKKCLFEVDIPLDNGKDQKTFILAKQDDGYETDEYYSAHIIYFDDKGKAGTYEIGLLWHTGEEKVVFAAYPYYEPIISHEREIEAIASGILQAFIPFVVHLNNLETEIISVSSVTHKRLPVGQDERSPFYDYHVISPKSRQVLDRIAEAHMHSHMPLHIRREHDRKFSHARFVNMRGKTIRIKQTEVGNEQFGVVGKEYSLSF